METIKPRVLEIFNSSHVYEDSDFTEHEKAEVFSIFRTFLRYMEHRVHFFVDEGDQDMHPRRFSPYPDQPHHLLSVPAPQAAWATGLQAALALPALGEGQVLIICFSVHGEPKDWLVVKFYAMIEEKLAAMNITVPLRDNVDVDAVRVQSGDALVADYHIFE